MRVSPSVSRALTAWAAGLLAVAAAAAVLHRSPFEASDFVVIPDSQEYALGAHRWATDGEYRLRLGGQSVPPRYPPWFSALALAPAYRLAGAGEPGNAIYPVTLAGIAGVAAAFFIGCLVSGPLGGLAAALLLLGHPGYRYFGRVVMTDVPGTALFLACGLAFAALRRSPQTNWRALAAAGLLAALGLAFRPLLGVALVPFVLLTACSRPLRGSLPAWALLLGPSALVLLGNLIYNAGAFGSPFRNGYQWWCSVPYDYASLTFAPGYLAENSRMLWRSLLPQHALLLGLLLALRVRRQRLGGSSEAALIEFAAAAGAPLVVFHLAYFFPASRFFLPPVAILAALNGGLLAALVPERWRPRLFPVAAAGAAVACACWRMATLPEPPARRLAADRVAALTPANALVISSIDPVYLEFFLGRHSHRRVLPLSRRGEYSSKLITRRRIAAPRPPPRDAQDHRCEGLRNAGAEEAVPCVAEERPELPAEALRQGRRVFLETSHTPRQDAPAVAELERRYTLQARGADLYELGAAR